MTVQNQNVKNVYRGNGSTTVFPFTFAINESHPEYIHVYITNDGGKAAETTDFTCDMETRTITYPKVSSSAPKLSATQRLTIYRLLPYEQNLNLVNQGPFFSEDVETQLDDLEMQIQQLNEEKGRSLRIGLEATDFDTEIPLVPGKTFRVNDAGNGFEVTEDPKAAREAAEAAQEAAEEAQGKAESAQEAAEQAQEDAESAKDSAIEAKDIAENIASQVDIMARALVYDNVADMVADTTLEVGQTTTTKGYHSVNDGGSSVYSVRAKTQSDVDDGGSVIFLASGNVAELIIPESVNVKQLGAAADGVTNDVNAFTVAVALGKDIVVPSGSYNLSAPVFYDGKVDNNGTYTEYGFMHLTDKVLLKNIRNLQEEYTITYDSSYVQQGSTYNTKTGKIILAIIKSDNSAQKLLVVDPSTYTIDDTYDYTTLGHCNSLTYCPANNRIYVGTLLNNIVSVLDADTMTVVDTIDMGYNPVVFGYDLKNKIFVGVRGYNNGSVQANFYDADLTYIKTETYEAPYNYMISNGGIAYDGQLIILSHSGYALCDYFGNVLNYVKINRNIDGALAILETEDCYIIDGVCYTAYIGAYGGATMVYKHNLMGEVGNLDARATYYRYNDTDLDTLVQAGRYYVNTTNVGTNNFPPASKAGFMEIFVINGTEDDPTVCKQVFYQIGSYDYRIYCRGKGSGGSWGTWKNITPYAKIKNSRVTASVVAQGTTGTHTVTFTEPFVDNVPAIFCQLVNSGTDTQLSDVGFGVYGASKTGFSVNIWNNMNTGITPIFYWVAVDIGDETV